MGGGIGRVSPEGSFRNFLPFDSGVSGLKYRPPPVEKPAATPSGVRKTDNRGPYRKAAKSRFY